MTRPDRSTRRPDLRARVDRDLNRYARRETGASSFWRSLGVIGSVGWPIVLTSVGGALVGRWLDARWHTGSRLTLALLLAGVIAGAAIAWHSITTERR